MEIQLQELIDRIKKEGVEVAETEASAMLKQATERAEQIVAQAKAQAEQILSDAKAETERMTKASEDAIRQAGRNLLISFRESITRQLKVIVEEKVIATYSSSDFSKIITRAIESWVSKPDAQNVSIILSEEDLVALEKIVLAEIKQKMLSGVVLKPSDNLESGFRIVANDGGAYYDYSAESVVDMISSYLSPKVVALLKEAE